jgi:hypothetical protein
MVKGEWKPAEVRWLEGSRLKQTPLEVFIQGAWRTVELLAEELRQGPDPADPRLRRYWLRIDEATYLLEGPFDKETWKLCARGPSLDD